MDEIEGWRNKIDEIDTQLLTLLNQRANCATEIGKIKAQNSIEIYNPAREREIIENLIAHNEGPLPELAIQNIFELIINECRSLEKE